MNKAHSRPRPKTTATEFASRQKSISQKGSLRPGFIKVEKEQDLKLNLTNLNDLFTKAVEVETGESTESNTTRKKADKTKPGTKPASTSRYEQEASEILANNDRLLEMLKDPITIEAMQTVGTTKEDLLPRSIESFGKENNRAWDLEPAIVQMRFKSFNERRKRFLVIVLQNLSKSKEHLTQNQQLKFEKETSIRTVFDATLEAEKQRDKRIQTARKKYELVVEKEALRQQKRRDDYEKHKKDMEQRSKRIAEERKNSQLAMSLYCEENKVKIEKVRQQKQLLEETRKEMKLAQIRYTDSRIAKLKSDKEKNKMLVQTITDAEIKRKQVLADAKATETKRLEELRNHMEKKDKLIQQKHEERGIKFKLFQEKKRLEQADRVANMKRIVNAKKYKNSKANEKIQETNAKIQRMKDLRLAIMDERGKNQKAQIIHHDNWRDKHSNDHVLPGPGEYEIGSTLHAVGGTWGHYNPKSDIEWKMRAASEVPGPGAYELQAFSSHLKGGTISKTPYKTSTQVLCEKSAALPGPGQYQLREISKSSSARFSSSQDISELDRQIQSAAELPGPGDYGADTIPRERPKLMELRKVQAVARTMILTSAWRRDTVKSSSLRNITEEGLPAPEALAAEAAQEDIEIEEKHTASICVEETTATKLPHAALQAVPSFDSDLGSSYVNDADSNATLEATVSVDSRTSSNYLYDDGASTEVDEFQTEEERYVEEAELDGAESQASVTETASKKEEVSTNN